jgi:hypothetical protein
MRAMPRQNAKSQRINARQTSTAIDVPAVAVSANPPKTSTFIQIGNHYIRCEDVRMVSKVRPSQGYDGIVRCYIIHLNWLFGTEKRTNSIWASETEITPLLRWLNRIIRDHTEHC